VDALTAEWDAIRQVRVCLSAREYSESRRFLGGALGSAGAQARCWGDGLSPTPYLLHQGGSSYFTVASRTVCRASGSPFNET
jgi:hypothetical protein